jgi:hypothetical protein
MKSVSTIDTQALSTIIEMPPTHSVVNLSKPRHIYFDEYIIGMEYQMIDKSGNCIDLGVLIKKQLDGRPYDMDMKLTYQKDGSEKEHIVVFGPHYREKFGAN